MLPNTIHLADGVVVESCVAGDSGDGIFVTWNSSRQAEKAVSFMSISAMRECLESGEIQQQDLHTFTAPSFRREQG